jgi:hypothetical protein
MIYTNLQKKVISFSPKGLAQEESDFAFFQRFYADDRRIAAATQILEQLKLLTLYEISRLKSQNLKGKKKIKILEQVILAHGPDTVSSLIQTQYHGQTDLLRLTNVIARNIRLRTALRKEPAVLQRVLSQIGVGTTTGEVTIEEHTAFGRVNFNLFVLVDEQPYFAKYVDPLGKEFFPRYAPKDTIQIYILVETIFRLLMGPQHVPETLYPTIASLKPAALESPQLSEDKAIAQRIIVQRDMRPSHVVWAGFEAAGIKETVAISSYAGLLAKLHGSSLGFYGQLSEDVKESATRKRVRQLLNEKQDQLRLKDPQSYEAWFLGEETDGKWTNWINRVIQPVFRKHQSGQETVALKERFWDFDLSELEALWTQTAAESISMIPRLGCLGHYDFTPYNQFLARDSQGEPVVFDFDYLAFTEPFYGVGHSLYSLNRFLHLKDKDSIDLEEAWKSIRHYLTEYKTQFMAQAAPFLQGLTLEPGETIDRIIDQGLSRAMRIAGFMTLFLHPQDTTGKNEAKFIAPYRELCHRLIAGKLS